MFEKWMSFSMLILQMAPMIMQMIVHVQQAFPGSGAGAIKHDVVVNTVKEVVAATPEAAAIAAPYDLAGAVSKIVNTQVVALKAASAPGFTATPPAA